MSDAETSAYLLMAAGAIWLMMGLAGLRRDVAVKEDEVSDQGLEKEHQEPLHRLDLRLRR